MFYMRTVVSNHTLKCSLFVTSVVSFVHTESNLTDLSHILHALAAPEIKILAKSLKLNVISQTRDKLIEMITKHGQATTIQTFFGKKNTNNSNSSMVCKR